VLEELRELGPVEAVWGNVDELSLRRELPEERVVEAGGVRIGMVHDAGPAFGREARLATRFSGCDAVVYGHTHLAQIGRVRVPVPVRAGAVEGDVWILNPGSPTERRRAPSRTMLVLDIGSGRIEPQLVTLS
jgi:putative phosphoesterase